MSDVPTPTDPNPSQNPPIHDQSNTDPCVIHHSDNPATVLVTPLLTVDNYGSWSRAVTMALRAKNKFGFVDGTLPCPTKADDISKWRRCNDMVASWILNSVSTEIRPSILYADTAAQIWTDLKDRLSQSNAPKIYQLKQSISALKQEGMTVSLYFTQLKSLWDELHSIAPINPCICGNAKSIIDQQNQDRAMEFLQGVHDRFSAVRSQILLMDPFPPIQRIYNIVRQEEKQQEINFRPLPAEESAALQASKVQYRTQGKRQRPYCEHCNKYGHTIATCYQIHGFPNKPPKKSESPSSTSATQLSSAQYQKLLSLLAKEDTMGSSVNLAGTAFTCVPFSWIIDSGASNHICTSLSYFSSYSPVHKNIFVQLPDGSHASVKHIGNIHCSPSLTLTNVYHIPSFKYNLLSLSQLTKSIHCDIIFSSSGCIFQDRATKKTIGRGSVRNGLFYLNEEPSLNKDDKDHYCLDHPSSSFFSKQCNKADLWHLRLGHPSISRFQFIIKNSPNINANKDFVCDVCPRAKQSRLPFSSRTSYSSHCFELIHVDIWGPFSTPSHNGSRYFLTIVDDYSRCTWLYLMQHKSETFTTLIHFFNQINRQFNTKINKINSGDGGIFLPQLQAIRSDNGSEFLSKQIQKWFHDHGIIHQRSCVATPQQNGVVERKHRHLLDVARALRFQANLPLSFWGECVLTAAYLINKLPTSILKYKSPHQILLGSPPSYSSLRVFGCLCFAKNMNIQHKFDERAKPGIFVGYPFNQKGYRIYDMHTRKIYVSRDVQFFETMFPYHDLQTPSFANDISINTQILDCEFDDSSSNLSPPSSLSPGISHHDDTIVPIPTPQDDNSSDIPSIPVETPQQHSPTAINPAERRYPQRIRTPSVRLTDHVCDINNVTSQSAFPLKNYFSLSNLSTSHRALLVNIIENKEPTSYSQAIKSAEWRDAMAKEIHALESNNTWVLSPLPNGKTAIGCKWVYKIKYHSNGTVERYKARLVAKGYNQVHGIDYHETFAPVAKLVTVRLLLSIAAIKNWPLHQLDVNNAFLQGDLNEEVYMKLPPGFSHKGKPCVCKLNKSIYGLKQASRQWFSKFSTTLIQKGFHQSISDYSLFTFKSNHTTIFVLVYVDDIIITGNNEDAISDIKKFLAQAFSIKDLGNLSYFLGIEVSRSKKGIFLCQRKYTLDILSDSGMTGCRPSDFPMEQHLRLRPNEGSPLPDPTIYRRLIGRLLYLTVTRPDIQYAVNTLSQFMQSPCTTHLDAATRVLRYLKGSVSKGLFLSASSSLNLVGYADSDWAGCPTTRRSTTGYFTMLGSNPISWKTKKQPTISRSSAEAEYRSLATLSSELQWLKYLIPLFSLIFSPSNLRCVGWNTNTS
jgi:hypothetical protein